MTLDALPNELLDYIARFISPPLTRVRPCICGEGGFLHPRDVETLEGAWSRTGNHFLCTQRIAIRPFSHGVVRPAEYANWHFDHTDLVFLDCFGAGKLFINCDQVWLDEHRDEAATAVDKFAEIAHAPAVPQQVGQVRLRLAKHLQMTARGHPVRWVIQRDVQIATDRCWRAVVA